MHGRRPALQKREKNINKNRGRRERLVEELKTDMEEIGEGQERIKEIRQKCEEIESERQKLKQQNMNISKQSDCNVIRMNLMLSILEARQDNSFVQADERTQLLRFVD
jgi:chromosome segregation ATPase